MDHLKLHLNRSVLYLLDRYYTTVCTIKGVQVCDREEGDGEYYFITR